MACICATPCSIPAAFRTNRCCATSLPGQGVLDLQSWVDAVKSTGYAGWWSCELFCNRQHQDNSFAVASDLKALMERLIPA